MRDKRLEILRNIAEGKLTIEQADKELLGLYNSNTCDEIFEQTAKSNWDDPAIKHFKNNDDSESNSRDNWEGKSIGGFNDW